MKRKIKGILFALCMVLSMMAFTACSEKKEEAVSQTSLSAEEITSYNETASQLISQVTAFTDAEIEQYMAMDDAFTTSALTSWTGVKEELGTFKSIISQDVKSENNIITVTSKAEFEKGNATVNVEIDLTQNALTGMDFSMEYPMSVLMKRAALNTMIGLGTVFLVLFFLTFLISLFKYIPGLERKFVGKNPETLPEPEVIIPQEALADKELLNDDELAAVIAAAIAASENTSTDGFVVRSIKKSNRILRRA